MIPAGITNTNSYNFCCSVGNDQSDLFFKKKSQIFQDYFFPYIFRSWLLAVVSTFKKIDVLFIETKRPSNNTLESKKIAAQLQEPWLLPLDQRNELVLLHSW